MVLKPLRATSVHERERSADGGRRDERGGGVGDGGEGVTGSMETLALRPLPHARTHARRAPSPQRTP